VNAALEAAGYSEIPAFDDDASQPNLKPIELFRERPNGVLPSGGE
jgi:hypothetical protein